jgi:hypothetical protein
LILALVAGALVAVAGAAGSSAPSGQYFFSRPAGNNEFTGDFTLHGTSVSDIGITTGLIACTRPPSTKVQYPGPPNNWQPQKTIPVHRQGVNLVFSYSGSFSDRVNGYPESMQISVRITPAGILRRKRRDQVRDAWALSFTGKHSA